MNSDSPSMPLRVLRKLGELALGRTPLGRWAGRLGPLRRAYERRVLARRDHPGLFCGLYASYAEALADVPPSRLAGWDHEQASEMWLDQIDPVFPSTYPVLFWLARLYGENMHLVDVGGSIGLTYYAARRYSAMPAGATWTVMEVDAIARQGRIVAEREQATALSFVDTAAALGRCDILLSAGVLQYMEHGIPGVLESMPEKPRYILLNKLPITSAEDAWSLQNYGPAVAPNRLFNEAEFLAYFDAHGYRVRDRWAVDLDCVIPFHPDRRIEAFAGFLFERERFQGSSA